MNMAAFWGAFFGLLVYDVLRSLWRWARKDKDEYATVWVDDLSDLKRGEPIVRCRDCKFCHKNYCEKRTSPTVSPSEIYWIPVEPDGFCKWGERKEVDE